MGKSKPASADQADQECTKCHRILPISKFTWRTDQQQRRRDCNECIATRMRSYTANPEVKHRMWVQEILRKYGVTEEQYNSMLETQNGKCLFCGRVDSDRRSWRLGVDHCHTCDKVRGLLCSRCNTWLSWVEEVGIEKISSYLCC